MTTKGTNLTTNPVLTPGSIDRSSKTQPILGSERVDTIGRDVISDKSERAKVSTSYGISRIHYGIILPLKQRVVGLNAEQKANLTLYQTHVALSDQVDKVKSAYKAYRTAQKTADKAPLEPAIPRKGARQEAQAAGDKLVKSYDDLIKLALERVDAHQLDKNDYLNDIHSELGQGTKKYILQTVNQLRARMPVENQALVKGSRDHGHSVKHQYYDFVMDFVSHVCAAKNASGGDVNPQEVSTAFIRGLASIPELSEGLTLIHFYNQLNSKEFANGIEDGQLNAVIDHFEKQLKALIERPEDITSAELKSIHCHGIALFSVLPEGTAESLNTLKATEKEHQEASLALEQAKSALEQNESVIKGETSYSFKDVEAFLEEMEEDKQILLDNVRNSAKAISSLAKVTQERSDLIEAKIKQIADLHKAIKALTDESIRKNTELEESIVQAQRVLDRFNREIAGQKNDLDKMEAELDKLNEEYKRFSKKKADPASLLSSITKKGYEQDKTEREKSIADHKVQIEQKIDEKKAQEKALEKLRTEKSELGKTYSSKRAEYSNKIATLDDEIEAVQTDPMITLSGKDVAEIAQGLGIENPGSPISRIAVTLSKTNAASNEVARLTGTIPANEKNIERLKTLKDSQVDIIELLTDENGQAQKKIKDQIASNLAVARAVTLEVGREVVKQGDEFAKSQQLPKTKMSHKQHRAAERVSPLASHLAEVPVELNLEQEITRRVKELPVSVTAASIPSRAISSKANSDIFGTLSGMGSSSVATQGSSSAQPQRRVSNQLSSIEQDDFFQVGGSPVLGSNAIPYSAQPQPQGLDPVLLIGKNFFQVDASPVLGSNAVPSSAQPQNQGLDPWLLIDQYFFPVDASPVLGSNAVPSSAQPEKTGLDKLILPEEDGEDFSGDLSTRLISSSENYEDHSEDVSAVHSEDDGHYVDAPDKSQSSGEDRERIVIEEEL